MSPIDRPHSSIRNRIIALFSSGLGPRAILSPQNPVRLDDHTELEPDLALLRPRADFSRSAHPRPADVFLIIEIMDTSADYDRPKKLSAYARSAIHAVWLVDLKLERIAIDRKPLNGRYTESYVLVRSQRLFPEAFPDLDLAAEDIWGPSES